MNVGELLAALRQLPRDLPVVYTGPDYAKAIAVEVTYVKRRAFVPHGGIATRDDVCLIHADPDAPGGDD